MPARPSEDRPIHEIAIASADQDEGSSGSKTAVGDAKTDASEARNVAQAPSQPRQRTGVWAKLRHKETDGASIDQDEPKSKKRSNFSVAHQIRATILNSWINVLLIAVPIGIAVNFVPSVGRLVVFVVNFIAIIPLAAMLSYATEEIALHTGETIGGLLNATFGYGAPRVSSGRTLNCHRNAVELIVSIIALFHDEIVIVQTSLIGSMLSNLLLVLGMCFFLGGLNRVEQHFNVTVAQTAASLLALAIASLIIPTAFNKWADIPGTQDDLLLRTDITEISRGTSILLLLVYGCYLFFQLRTHVDLYNEPSPKAPKRNVQKGEATNQILSMGGSLAAHGAGEETQGKIDPKEKEEDEQPQLNLAVAIFTLVWSTALVGVCAEFLVDSISTVTESTGVSRTFVGLILLPIIGNAAEHATSVTVACKDKMDLAIGVAVGSSMQVALLVLPFVVVIGWIAGKSDMDLNFNSFEVIILFVSVLLVNYLIGDGKSHWLEGVLLTVLYLIIALAAWSVKILEPSQWFMANVLDRFFPNAAATGSGGGQSSG